MIPKKIWIFWDKGWKNAPAVTDASLKSWRIKNPSYELIKLDRDNLNNYLEEATLNKILKHMKVEMMAAFSDMLRIELLSKYGGIWVDATTICLHPLDKWITLYENVGFFAFSLNVPGRPISTWFLAANKDNQIITKWKNKVDDYWNGRENFDNYFWFHGLFEKLLDEDKNFKEIWDNVNPKISANHCLHFGPNDPKLNECPSPNILEALKSPELTPVSKLTHKINFDMSENKNSFLNYVIMNQQLAQISKYTTLNRYPDVFSTISKYVSSELPFLETDRTLKILSFGCSTGEEILTLKDMYFKNIKNLLIHGVEFDETTRNVASEKTGMKIYGYDEFILENNEQYDIIFAMSVFCRWPEHLQPGYDFEDFQKGVTEIATKVKFGGILVIYNSQFLFEETATGTKFKPIVFDEIISSGFVKKFHKNKIPCENHNICFYKRTDGISLTSLKTTTNNLGDCFQIIACNEFLNNYFNVKPDYFIDRDSELKDLTTQNLLILNGWMKHCIHSDECWPPINDVDCLITSFHMRPSQCSHLLSEKSVDFLKRKEPIGAKDIFTQKLLQSNNINSYLSRCITLTLPKRKKLDSQSKIFVISRDNELFESLPLEIKQTSNIVNLNTQYSESTDFNENIIKAKLLLESVALEAKLVITTFLQTALTCIAMNIPVVVFYPNYPLDSQNHQSDVERFSAISDVYPVRYFSEIPNLNIDTVDHPRNSAIDKIIAELIISYQKTFQDKFCRQALALQ